MTSYEALYGKPCRSLLHRAELDEHVVMGPQVIEETTEKICVIRDKLKAIQSRQKKYTDFPRWEVEFDIDDFFFLKVWVHLVSRASWHRDMFDPFEITERIGDVAYCVRLPPHLSHVHDVFHVLMLKKYTCDLSHVLPYVEILLQPNVTYKE